MIPVRDRLIVHCDLDQKAAIKVGGKSFLCTPKFALNHREKAPVVATVITGNDKIPGDSVIITHHNLFYGDSHFALGDGLFSIPYNENIFALLDEQGNAHSIGGNIIAQRVEKKLPGGFEQPPANYKNYKDRLVILSDGEGFKAGQVVFTILMADYEIVYNWDGNERRIIKVLASDIVAVLKNP